MSKQNYDEILLMIDELKELRKKNQLLKFVDYKDEIKNKIKELPKEEQDKLLEELNKIKQPKGTVKERNEHLMKKKLSPMSPSEALLALPENDDNPIEEIKDTDTIITNKNVEETITNESSNKEESGKGKMENQVIETPLNEQIELMTEDIEEQKKKHIARLKTKVKRKKLRMEDTHTRKTYLIRNDLLERIEKISDGTHGFKTEFINFAIELGLAEFEAFDEEE